MAKYKFLTLFIATFISFNYSFANDCTLSLLQKEINQTFDVNDNVLMGVQNKYGDIDITTWSQNKIVVDVLIKVKTKNKSKGQTFLDAIDVDFSHSSSKVGMKTVYPNQDNSSWWGSWWNNSNNILFEVHYKIKAPEGISTTLINKYGNIKQSNITGNCNVTNKYGDIYLDDIGGDLTINLGYGKTTVSQAKDVTVDIKNSTLKIKNCDNVHMSSKYSDFTFGTCGNMSLDSKYDEFKIGSAKQINNDGKYDEFKIGDVESFIIDTKNSTININKINKVCIVDAKYGTLSVNSTGESMENIRLESKYTDYTFGVDADFYLKFFAEYSDLNIHVPHEIYKSYKDGNEKEILAYRGDKEANLKIKATLKYGSLKITDNTN